MSLESVRVIFRHNARLLLGDPSPVVVFILTPLLVMAVLRPTQRIVLMSQGYVHVNGAEQVVPGLTVMFAFFWLAFVGRTFFAEHAWGTWERLQSSPASTADVLVGKLAPAFAVVGAQMLILFALAGVIFDLDSRGQILDLLIVAVPLVTCVLALMLALVALCRTMTQLDAASSLLMMTFAALGGSLVTIKALPDWVQKIAPITPNYWANKAAQNIVLKGKGIGAVLPSAGMLLAFTVVFSVVVVARFRMTDQKAIA